MPRHGSESSRPSRAARPERPRSSERRQPVNVDEQVLTFREADASYSTIARRLALHRANDAHSAFIRALSARSGDEQRQLVTNEQARLDRLEVRIRERDAAQPEKLERRLLAVAKLRASLP